MKTTTTTIALMFALAGCGGPSFTASGAAGAVGAAGAGSSGSSGGAGSSGGTSGAAGGASGAAGAPTDAGPDAAPPPPLQCDPQFPGAVCGANSCQIAPDGARTCCSSRGTGTQQAWCGAAGGGACACAPGYACVISRCYLWCRDASDCTALGLQCDFANYHQQIDGETVGTCR